MWVVPRIINASEKKLIYSDIWWVIFESVKITISFVLPICTMKELGLSMAKNFIQHYD